jgi:hypothetical protein
MEPSDPAFAHLDRAPDAEPIRWAVRHAVTAAFVTGERYGERYREAIAAETDIELITEPALEDDTLSATIAVRARTAGDARAQAERVFGDAALLALRTLPEPERNVGWWSSIANPEPLSD